MAKTSCSYHANKPATWQCEECAKSFCDKCVVVIAEGPRSPDPRCPLCENRLTFLGTGQTAKPFWAVAPIFFGYTSCPDVCPLLRSPGSPLRRR